MQRSDEAKSSSNLTRHVNLKTFFPSLNSRIYIHLHHHKYPLQIFFYQLLVNEVRSNDGEMKEKFFFLQRFFSYFIFHMKPISLH